MSVKQRSSSVCTLQYSEHQFFHSVATKPIHIKQQISNNQCDWWSPRSEAKASAWLQSTVSKMDVILRYVFIVECGIVRFLCAMHVLGFGHHPLGYICVKFCFFHSLHCWASPWRKIVHSITHTASLMHQEPKLLLRNKIIKSLEKTFGRSHMCNK